MTFSKERQKHLDEAGEVTVPAPPALAPAAISGRRRRVVEVSEVDRQRIERGELPSWMDPQGEPKLSDLERQTGEEPNDDQRLTENVPPHWGSPA